MCVRVAAVLPVLRPTTLFFSPVIKIKNSVKIYDIIIIKGWVRDLRNASRF